MNSTKQIIQECLFLCRATWSAWLTYRHCTDAEFELAKLKLMLINAALEEITEGDPAGEPGVIECGAAGGDDPAGKPRPFTTKPQENL